MISRKIIVCMDGTGNEVGEHQTNVLKLYRALRKSDPAQPVLYVPGVGTMDSPRIAGSWEQRIKGVFGLAFGLGLEDDVMQAYRFLCRTYRDSAALKKENPRVRKDQIHDDRIYLFGFSRGAYAARVLAGFIHNFGLIRPEELHLAAQVFRAYRKITAHDRDDPDDQVFQRLREYGEVLNPETVPIRALGLFDTVNSILRIGRPWKNLRRYGSLVEFGHHASVDSNASVRIVRQALAVDERRSMFRPRFWVETPYFGNRFKRGEPRTQFVEQRWFAGYHGDIGGSAYEDESQIGKATLKWMLDGIEEADRAADAEDGVDRPDGYGFDYIGTRRETLLEGDTDGETPGGRPYARPDGTGPIHDSMTPPWRPVEWMPKSVRRRDWPAGRPGYRFYLPRSEPRTIPGDHVIDPSVAARMDAIPGYRPINVVERA